MEISSLFIDKTRVSGIWATWAFLAQERFLNRSDGASPRVETRLHPHMLPVKA
jgi:hypothetical protein